MPILSYIVYRVILWKISFSSFDKSRDRLFVSLFEVLHSECILTVIEKLCIIVKRKARKDANTNELYLLEALQRYESNMLELLLSSDNEKIGFIAK